MPSPSGPARLFADLAQTLGRLSISWYAFGAQVVLIWGRPRMTDMAGTAVPVISPEDLIATKVLAGRSRDVEVIRGVLAERRDRIRVDQVRAVLAMLETALGQGDLLPLFEREWDRAAMAPRR